MVVGETRPISHPLSLSLSGFAGRHRIIGPQMRAVLPDYTANNRTPCRPKNHVDPASRHPQVLASRSAGEPTTRNASPRKSHQHRTDSKLAPFRTAGEIAQITSG